MNKLIKLSLVFFTCCLCTTAMAVNRFIVKYKPNESQIRQAQREIDTEKAKETLRKQLMVKLSHERVAALSNAAGVSARDSHAIATGAHVVMLDQHLDKISTKQFIDKLQQDSSIEYVVEDRVMYAAAISANPNQWDMTSTGQFQGNQSWHGDNFVNAWDTLAKYGYTPGKDTNIGVIDSGYTPHPNFINSLVLLNQLTPDVYGYTFISDCRDAGSCPASYSDSFAANSTYSQYLPDGLDLGDFISVQDKLTSHFSSYTVDNSSWHGSHITGSIAAQGYNSNNPNYVVGGAYAASIIPVRVLGKGGVSSYESDVINGMSWAAGMYVNNVGSSAGIPVPLNKNPADVINISLESGSDSNPTPCDVAYQEAINNVVAKGVIVVVAAGNNHSNITKTMPAGCKNVISVAAKGPANTLTSYSNYGPTTIIASGGDNSQASLSEVYSTAWSSSAAYQSVASGGNGTWIGMDGTSSAAPHVTAAIATIIGIYKARGKSYTNQDIINILQTTAIPLANNCNIDGCATNLALDADAAVQRALALTATTSAAPTLYKAGWLGAVVGVVVAIII